MAKTVVVVPCYNEAERLPVAAFRDFIAATPGVDFIFVNDGSDDATLDLLNRLAGELGDRLTVLDQQPNQGKAAAVRTGMLHALDHGATYAGYLDADLSTPVDEVKHFIAILDRMPDIEIVFGSRVRLLGRDIRRNPLRHYLGRVFATVASMTLDLPVYDTQCGAKLFRASAATRALFADPFLTGWIFDVEILGRLIRDRRAGGRAPADVVYELPLASWRDVAGSKVKATDFMVAMGEMWRIYRTYLATDAATAVSAGDALRTRSGVDPPT